MDYWAGVLSGMCVVTVLFIVMMFVIIEQNKELKEIIKGFITPLTEDELHLTITHQQVAYMKAKKNIREGDKMTKRQKAFFDYLQKLKTEEREGTRFVETAQKEFFRYWEMYEKQGVKDSMTLAMEATEAFVGHPVKAHMN